MMRPVDDCDGRYTLSEVDVESLFIEDTYAEEVGRCCRNVKNVLQADFDPLLREEIDVADADAVNSSVVGDADRNWFV